MAGAALIVKDDGSIEATPELREALHMKPGTRLELVEHSDQEAHFRVPSPGQGIRNWRDLGGLLADSAVDLSEERRKERQGELERDDLRRG
jgi:hypothetical protein